MANNESSSLVESLLSVALPSDYREFLDSTGYLCLTNIGIEVYGYKPHFDAEKIPCVIGATRLNKDAYGLTNSEIVISHTGFEELIAILDTTTGHVFEVGFSGARNRVADSFSTWLGSIKAKDVAAQAIRR